jgi:hypothetical protein
LTREEVEVGAFVKHEFKKGFLLNEERLRKIHEILRKRLTGIEGPPEPVYKVYRADSFTYTTSVIEDVLNEENSEWQRIESLNVSIRSNEKFKLDLDFRDRTVVHIEGEDRDLVFLVFSDLRQYLSNEVNVLKFAPWKTVQIAGVVLATIVLGIWFFFALWVYVTKDPSIDWKQEVVHARALMEGQDINEKLNWLIETSLPEPETPSAIRITNWVLIFLAFFGVGLMGISIAGEQIPKFRKIVDKFLFPTNVFLFGRERERYEKTMALRRNLFWVVFVGFIVSIGAGLSVWFITT